MKLLVDFNLSPKLIPFLLDLFPGSAHIQTFGFAGETADEVIWEYARDGGFGLLTSDCDFLEIANERGFPPKVIRLARMNYRTRTAVEILRRNAIRIGEFGQNSQAVLVLHNQ